MMRILTIIADIIYIIVLNTAFYTDSAMMPDGKMRHWQRSPLSRLNLSDMSYLYYLQLLCIAVSVVTAVMLLFGMKSETLKKVWIISSIISALVFVIILIVTANSHAKYA